MLDGLPQEALIALAGFSGLLVGSFLNVVIYRLPKIMEQQWAAECAELTGQTTESPSEKLSLMSPRSRCSNCGHTIAWHENIPLLSYIFLRGKCSVCGTPFGIRYPVIELSGGLLFGFCAVIDWDTTLLPDDITLPLMWVGLVLSALQLNPAVSLHASVWGAVGGYLSLWLVYWAFKLVTGKEGMGYGDFKLFAALGAWFGWAALVPIILMASVIGAVVGIAMKFSSGLREGGYVPFGPFLAGAGFTAMVFGPQSILRAVGL
jgi:leader peptidase (prepilin peptidase)/N-methyltransferase